MKRRGWFFDYAKALEAWEGVVREHEKANNSGSYSKTISMSRAMAKRYNEYIMVRAAVIALSFGYDAGLVKILESCGYKIDVKNYANSLANILVRNDNNLTQVNVIRSELGLQHQRQVRIDFNEIIANLSAALGFNVRRNLRLAEYNSLVKVIKKRNHADQQR